MTVPTIALYASPPSSVCSTPHQININAHTSYDCELNSRSSSSSASATTASSSQRSIVGGLSCLFSSPSVKHSTSLSYSPSGEDLGPYRGEDLSSSFSYSSSKFVGSSLKNHQSPVSVFQGPVSCSSSSPPMRIAREKCGDMNFQGSFRGGASGPFNGFVRNALGSCIDYDSPSFEVNSSRGIVDELTFNMDDGLTELTLEPYAKKLLSSAQLSHKIFSEDFVVKAFYEAEKAHRGQMRASGCPYLQHCVETAELLASIGANSTVVAAGLLHDTLDDSFVSYDYIFRTFGAGVADLVEGVRDVVSICK